MKYLKIYESFESFDKINEEWFPRGPWIALKSNNGGTVAEFFDTTKGTTGIQFIKGKGNHIEEIKTIISTLYNDKNIETAFHVNGLDDCKVKALLIHGDNIKSIETSELEKFTEYLETLGKVKREYGGYFVKLNKPIEIFISEGEQKSKLKFSKKLDKLYYCLENRSLPNTKESNELLDKIIGMFKK